MKKGFAFTLGVLLCEAVVETTQHVVVEPYGLGFLIEGGDSNNSDHNHDAMQILMSAMTERDAGGAPVGLDVSPSHHVVAFGNTSTFSVGGGEADVYLDGIATREVSVSADIMGGSATVSLRAFQYLGHGNVSTFEPSTVVEVGNETVRLDVRVSGWSFCTAFGENGGRKCPTPEQDIMLEGEGALPDPPTPPPPHTLLIPRCDGDTVAALRLVCDPRLPVCADIASVKFYLGEADQPPGQAPNTATIGGSDTKNKEALAEFAKTGVYEHNLTTAEVGGFLNVTSLTPGLDYVFWSVWEHDNGSAPESNSRDFDLSRVQYWQCPGTTIARNFEMGTSLDVSFVVSGSAPLTEVCYAEYSSGEDGGGGGGREEDAFSSNHHGASRGRRLLDQNETIFDNTVCTDEGEEDKRFTSWRWGADGATFALGDNSRIRLAGHAKLDEGWTPLRNGFSTANEEGDVTASLESFADEAVLSTLLFFNDETEAFASESSRDNNDQTATWVAISFGVFLLWLLGCCGARILKDSHAARTWPAAVARARARFNGAFDISGASSFGSIDSSSSSFDTPKKSHLYGTTTTATTALPGGAHSDDGNDAPWLRVAAPLAGWTTPGSVISRIPNNNNEPAQSVGPGGTEIRCPQPQESFPLYVGAEVEAAPPIQLPRMVDRRPALGSVAPENVQVLEIPGNIERAEA